MREGTPVGDVSGRPEGETEDLEGDVGVEGRGIG